MKSYILPLSDERADLETVGGKGMSLARLVTAGLPVPDGFHITTEAYRQFVTNNQLQPTIEEALADVDLSRPSTLESAARVISRVFSEAKIPGELASEILHAYVALPGSNPAVAVRSSATAEDLPGASFAGQQETYLNICGADRLLEATQKCWASLWTGRAIGYRLRQRIGAESVSLAVVVQLQVEAEAAGILFTANPTNGDRDEAVINASWGLGEAIVGGAVTPDTLTIRKIDGQVIRRETVEKLVMTVRTETGVEEQPLPVALQKAPVLSDRQAAELTRFGAQIEGLYGMPMDIEWALSDGKFAILQARPITALPEPAVPVSIEWIRPNPKGQYMRGSIVDLLPDPISPLFATLAIPAIARVGVKEVLRPLTRSEPDLPDDYITTINEYAYMSASFTPHQWWWILVHMMASFPRILREALPLWRDVIRPRYAAAVAHWEDVPLESLTPGELWSGIKEMNDAAMMHMASLLVATTGASAGAEMLFGRVYEKMIQHEGDPATVTYVTGYDSTPIQAEKGLYDLAAWSREQEELAAYLLETPTEQLAAQVVEGHAPVAGWTEFRERLQTHQQTYGHMIYNLDFARPLPMDDPTPKLETIKMYLRGQGINPHDRQRAAEAQRIAAAETILKRSKGLRRWAFRKTLGMAQTMAEVRENAISDIGLGYPLLRRMLRQLGGALAQAGVIVQGEDIFFLEASEVQQAVDALERGGQTDHLIDRVAQRKVTHKALRQVTPPPMLPPKKRYMGINMDIFTPAAEDSQIGSMLKGIPASTGRVTAPACVLHGPEDFDEMRPGFVLVAAITTPAWTPLFAMASAVVTDIGGPLSHGSIVAREYGIPAVMGTGVATKRIHSGQVVTVDGDAGKVLLEKTG